MEPPSRSGGQGWRAASTVRRPASIGDFPISFNATLTTLNAFAVTPSDSTQISAFGFYVGVTGNVAVMPKAQEDKATPVAVTFVGVPAGAIIPLNIVRVMSTNTTASDIVAFGPT